MLLHRRRGFTREGSVRLKERTAGTGFMVLNHALGGGRRVWVG